VEGGEKTRSTLGLGQRRRWRSWTFSRMGLRKVQY
jgi:hypothetical protein